MFERIRNKYYLNLLRNSPYRPQKELIYRFNKYYICTLVRESSDNHISAGSMDRDLNHAVAKAISEYIERLYNWTLAENENQQAPYVNYDNTGFAAYPKLSCSSLKKARDRSLEDSTEKYCWPEFFHNHSIGYQLSEAGKADPMLSDIPDTGIVKTQYIYPKVDGDLHFCICLGFVGKHGIIPGTACHANPEKAREDSFTEMIRKLLIAENYLSGKLANNTEFSKRLIHLYQNGKSIYDQRLKFNGPDTIHLPPLKEDKLLAHPFDKDYVVYRTLFHGQQPYFNSDRNCSEIGYV